MSFGSRIYHKPYFENSLDFARAELETLEHGTLLLADAHGQTRGRQGRVWQQRPGQLLLTFVIKPEQNFDQLALLSMALTLGILAPLKKYGVSLKWPNDFMFGGKKVGGMIVHSVWNAEFLQGLILGVGINVTTTFESEDSLSEIATSLAASTQEKIDSTVLQNSICQQLDSWYGRWKQREYETIFAEWKNAMSLLGREICVHDRSGKKVCGVMIDVTRTGEMILQDTTGVRRTIAYYQTL